MDATYESYIRQINRRFSVGYLLSFFRKKRYNIKRLLKDWDGYHEPKKIFEKYDMDGDWTGAGTWPAGAEGS